MEDELKVVNVDKLIDMVANDYDLNNYQCHQVQDYIEKCVVNGKHAHYYYDEEKGVWRCSKCGAALPDGIDEFNMPFIIEDVRYCYHCGSPMSEDIKVPYHFIMNYLEDLDLDDYNISGVEQTFKKVIMKIANDMIEEYKKVENGKV